MTKERLEQIKQLIEDNPGWSRWRISIRLCELWDWRVPDGPLKDISCRDLLMSLDKAGAITLPAPRPTNFAHERRRPMLTHDSTPVTAPLQELRPLRVENIGSGAALAEFKSMLAQHHYLGFDRTVGENMKYVVRSKGGAILALLLFGSAAWACHDREAFIGWTPAQRRTRLQLVTNNTRFLIPSWVHVPHLASHALSLVARRITDDWQAKYGHKVVLLETFVERGRFRGTCYQAANWIRVGTTSGRGREDRRHENALPEKDIYMLPLARGWRGLLSGNTEAGEETRKLKWQSE